MNILDVERIICRGAASLAEGLNFYWPTSSLHNEIHEANTTLHMGRALLDAGFLAFSEANPHEKARVHLDLIGIHPSERLVLLCEFKRLYSPEKAQEMIHDVERIVAFNVQRSMHHVHERLDAAAFPRFGLVAATTWDEAYANWFSSTSSNAPHRTLSPLWAALPSPDCTSGAYPLSYRHDPEQGHGKGKAIQHWLVYILFTIP